MSMCHNSFGRVTRQRRTAAPRQLTDGLQESMLPHDALHPFPVHWNTETASGDRSDHACPIRRMLLRDLDELGISSRRHTGPGLDRAATRNLMDRLPAHTGDTSNHRGSTSVGDHRAGSGHTDAHVQSRKSSPATSNS